jgi:type IV secretion system protein VirD4
MRFFWVWAVGAIVMILLSIWLLAWVSFELFLYWQGVDIAFFPWDVFHYLDLIFNSQALVICFVVTFGSVIAILAYTVLFKTVLREKTFGDAHFAGPIEMVKSGLLAKEGIILGKKYGATLRMPGFESVLVVGPTGAGKTRSIAIPNLMTWHGSGVYNDLKGELWRLTAEFRTKHLGQDCYLFAPASGDIQAHKYNPFFYVSIDPRYQIRDLQLIAEILIPNERVDGGFWTASSRDMFIMLALYLFGQDELPTLAAVHDLSKREDFGEWLAFEVEKGDIQNEVFYQNANSLLGADAERTQKNIIKDFHSRMTLFVDPLVREATSENDFDLSRLRKDKMNVYIHIPEGDQKRLQQILTLFWAQLTDIMTRKEPDLKEEPIPVLALMDEFGSMAKIPKLQAAMSFMRSYRIRCIVMVQYLGQIYSVYGRYDSKAFLNAKAKVVFALNDLDDAKYFSALTGNKTVRVVSKTVGSGQAISSGHFSRNHTERGVPLLQPSEVGNLSSNKLLLMREGKSPIIGQKAYIVV